MPLKQSHKQQSGNKKNHNPGRCSSTTISSSSTSLVSTKSKRVNLSLETKLDKFVTTFDRLIFRRELDYSVIEKHFGNQICEFAKADNFWQCFIEALIRKLGSTEDEAFNRIDVTNFTNQTQLEDTNYMEVAVCWILWEMKEKLDTKFRLPSVGDFLSYVSKYLDDPEIRGAQHDNTFIVIAIFIYRYPLSEIRELAQLNNGYILNYLIDQIVDSSMQTTIYALFALQRVLEASILPSNSSNYFEFQDKLKQMASLLPKEEVTFDMDLSAVDDPLRAIQASMLAKITLKKLDELHQLSSLPPIWKKQEPVSLFMRNWFCGTSFGYTNYQMDRSIPSISKQRHLYFEMMYLTTGSIKVGICNNLTKYFKGDGVDLGYEMTTHTHTYSFDGYQKVSTRDYHNQDNLIVPMVVGEISAGSVIGIRLDSVDRKVTYYLDEKEIKEKRGTKATRSNRSWESYPYYVTISLAAMQQAIILLRKEEWISPPNFKEELHELYHEDWKFRMCH